MKTISRNLPYIAVALMTLIIGVAAGSALGQDKTEVKEKIKEHTEKMKEMSEKMKDMAEKMEMKDSRGFCNNHNWSSDNKVSINEVREMTVAAGGLISVDGRQNGGISVKGEDRSDIVIKACIQAWGANEADAKTQASNIRIGTAGTIKAEGPSDDNHWSVSFQLLVPRSTNLKLAAHNGGISITNVDGSAEFETLNGGVSLMDVSGDVKGRTMNGGVNVSLSGNAWRGAGLDVSTTNGGVNITLPENFAAHFETSTVNGGFSTDIDALNAARPGDVNGRRPQPVHINTDLNGGGSPIRVSTKNGGVRISSQGGSEKKIM